MKRVQLEVAGQKLSLKTDADAAYVKSLARFVDEKIAEAKRGSRTVATQSLAILAALNIADDLFKARKKEETLRKTVRARSQTLLELLDKVSEL